MENTPNPADFIFSPLILLTKIWSKMVFEEPKWNRNTYLRVENESFLGARKPSIYSKLTPLSLHEIRKERDMMTIYFEK